MPHFYFHFHECETVYRDPEGRELADLDAAKEAAIKDARSIMRSELAAGKLCLGCWVDIEDAEGNHLLRVTVKEAVEITGL